MINAVKGLKKKSQRHPSSLSQMKKKALRLLSNELISVIILSTILIMVILPFFSKLEAAGELDDKIQKEFRQLVMDIEAIQIEPKNEQYVQVGFRVNKGKENYRLTTKRACLEKEAPLKDDCKKIAEICIEDIEGAKRAKCETINNGNFKKNSAYFPKGDSVTIIKDKTGMIEFEFA